MYFEVPCDEQVALKTGLLYTKCCDVWFAIYTLLLIVIAPTKFILYYLLSNQLFSGERKNAVDVQYNSKDQVLEHFQ